MNKLRNYNFTWLFLGIILSIIRIIPHIQELIEVFRANSLFLLDRDCKFNIILIMLISSLGYIIQNKIKIKGGILAYGAIFTFIVLMLEFEYLVTLGQFWLIIMILITVFANFIASTEKIKHSLFLGLGISTIVLLLMILEVMGCDMFYINTITYLIIFTITNFITTILFIITLFIDKSFKKIQLNKKEFNVLIGSILISLVGSLYFALIPTNNYVLPRIINNSENITINSSEKLNIKQLIIIILSFIFTILLTPVLYVGLAFSLYGNCGIPKPIIAISGLLTIVSIILAPFLIILGFKKNNIEYYLNYPLIAYCLIFVPGFGGIILGIIYLVKFITKNKNHLKKSD